LAKKYADIRYEPSDLSRLMTTRSVGTTLTKKTAHRSQDHCWEVEFGGRTIKNGFKNGSKTTCVDCYKESCTHYISITRFVGWCLPPNSADYKRDDELLN
jgi:hypothetical protein